MAELPGEFAGVLREQRVGAGLTQQDLADAAGLSLRTVSDLERGLSATPQRETVRQLGDALHLIGGERTRFETAARGRPLEIVSQAAAAAAMRSLPRDVASFTGRQRELEQLAHAAAGTGGVVGIHAIGGMAGVGKTAFAVHAAHRLADRFPGGQLFLPLHGHTPGQRPVDPADALASLLLTIGVPPAQVPPGLEARAALWRDRVAGKPLLLVLDDAAGSEQVRLLLPGAGGSLVLVTSRRHLSALDDATAISLDTLPPADAAELLVRLAGRAGMSPGDPGVREITRLCGFLPLAIGMAARQLRHHPAWTAAGRAAELVSARDRLALMETENLSVAAAFDLSYAALPEERQRLFRRIGLHPGADIDGYAAAALDGISFSAARRGLDALYDHHLLGETAQGRYRLHDLLREHARALAARIDPEQDRETATGRLLDFYQHTAADANARIARRTRPGAAADGVAAEDVTPAAVPVLNGLEQALTWARAERANLLDCLDYAAGAGQHARVTALTAGLGGLLLQDGPWADAMARHMAAVQAARQLGDQLGQANALSDLGYLARLTDDYPAAVLALEEALGLYRELGNRLGQANALSNLGTIRLMTDEYPAAMQPLEEALGLYRDLDDRLGLAISLSLLGLVQKQTDAYPAAVRTLQEALGVYRDLDNRLGLASVLVYLGDALQLTGDYPAAVRTLQEALGVYLDLDDRLGKANALAVLGTPLALTGDYPAAALALEEALGLYNDLGNRIGPANVFRELGRVRRLTGDYPAAAQALDDALTAYLDLDARRGTAETLNERGTLHRVSGELALAQQCHQQSLEISRELDDSIDQAHALAGLGRCAADAGDVPKAGALLRQALEIFQRIGAAGAAEVLAELDAIAAPRLAP
jgi:tetratricopeptide (TPR) repeat protein/transcriptional regulator with XRE-family HTH domain